MSGRRGRSPSPWRRGGRRVYAAYPVATAAPVATPDPDLTLLRLVGAVFKSLVLDLLLLIPMAAIAVSPWLWRRAYSTWTTAATHAARRPALWWMARQALLDVIHAPVWLLLVLLGRKKQVEGFQQEFEECRVAIRHLSNFRMSSWVVAVGWSYARLVMDAYVFIARHGWRSTRLRASTLAERDTLRQLLSIRITLLESVTVFVAMLWLAFCGGWGMALWTDSPVWAFVGSVIGIFWFFVLPTDIWQAHAYMCRTQDDVAIQTLDHMFKDVMAALVTCFALWIMPLRIVTVVRAYIHRQPDWLENFQFQSSTRLVSTAFADWKSLFSTLIVFATLYRVRLLEFRYWKDASYWHADVQYHAGQVLRDLLTLPLYVIVALAPWRIRQSLPLIWNAGRGLETRRAVRKAAKLAIVDFLVGLIVLFIAVTLVRLPSLIAAFKAREPEVPMADVMMQHFREELAMWSGVKSEMKTETKTKTETETEKQDSHTKSENPEDSDDDDDDDDSAKPRTRGRTATRSTARGKRSTTPVATIQVAGPKPLAGHVVCITGKLCVTRRQVADAIERAGGEFRGALTTDVTDLVVGDDGATTSKAAAAARNGIAIMDETTFWALVGGP